MPATSPVWGEIGPLAPRYLASMILSKLLLVLFLWAGTQPLPAQRPGGFLNLNVEEGLIQSQAFALAQDSGHYLYVATLGGLSRFNGHRFENYSRADGLPSIPVSGLYGDRDGCMWLGLHGGLLLMRDDSLSFFPLPQRLQSRLGIRYITQAPDGRILTLADGDLYEQGPDSLRRSPLPAGLPGRCVALGNDPAGRVWVYATGRGLYQLRGGEWRQISRTAAGREPIGVNRILFHSSGDTLLAADAGLFRLRDGRPEPWDVAAGLPTPVFDLVEDQRGRIWVGTQSGAARITGRRVERLREAQGLTNNQVWDIMMDAEGNLWLSTDEDGIFRYREQPFTVYDQSAGLTDPTVIGITHWRDQLLVSTPRGGLFSIAEASADSESVEPVSLSRSFDLLSDLNVDREGRLWLSDLRTGYWRRNTGGQFESILRRKRDSLRPTNAFHVHRDSSIFLGSRQGLYQLLPGSDRPLRRTDYPVYEILAYRGDTLLIAGKGQVYRYAVTSGESQRLDHPAFREATFTDVTATTDRHYLLATADRGLLMLDGAGRVRAFDKRHGLPSDFIYSVYAEGDMVWLGTGYGISCLQFTAGDSLRLLRTYTTADGLPGMETNQHSVFRHPDGSLWMGLVKGLVRFDSIRPPASVPVVPRVHLREVRLFSQPVDWRREGQLRLGPRENHLTFLLDGILLSDPGAVRYRYRLKGLEDNFTVTEAPRVVFSSIPPGDYEFEAYAEAGDGTLSSNRVRYPVHIRAPFYQTTLFRGGTLLGLLLLAGLFHFGRLRRLEQRREELERVRSEEFDRLRKRTAEDFHDEMGNKLTRISLLTDIMQTRLPERSPEVSRLMDQIRDNVAALYSGSRDIIWSLHPGHDDLLTIVERLRDVGSELFSETEIEFSYERQGEIPARQLSLEYSRNLQMIGKEVLNNILKHARADRVRMRLDYEPQRGYTLTFSDDGRGFDPEKKYEGNGLKNLCNRARRLRAELRIASAPGSGTRITLDMGTLIDNRTKNYANAR